MMRSLSGIFRACAADQSGSMLIETAVVTPALVLMAIGGFEASNLVARQSELQSAAAEAATISLAAPPETETEVQTIRDVIKMSTDLDNDHVDVTRVVRCGTNTAYVAFGTDCGDGVTTSTFLSIVITDSYTPQWASFGLGGPVEYNVSRTVQIS